jgi:hypothetical protein
MHRCIGHAHGVIVSGCMSAGCRCEPLTPGMHTIQHASVKTGQVWHPFFSPATLAASHILFACPVHPSQAGATTVTTPTPFLRTISLYGYMLNGS